MFEWFKGMVDASTGRLRYLYDPENDRAAMSRADKIGLKFMA